MGRLGQPASEEHIRQLQAALNEENGVAPDPQRCGQHQGLTLMLLLVRLDGVQAKVHLDKKLC